MTKRCLALGIWLHRRTHTSYNDSAKSTEKIGQFFFGTEVTYSLPPCSSRVMFSVALLRIAESMLITLRATPTYSLAE